VFEKLIVSHVVKKPGILWKKAAVSTRAHRLSALCEPDEASLSPITTFLLQPF
jgi:hypothetical protein